MNKKIRVVIWNEFRHEKTKENVKALYPDGLHATIKSFLDLLSVLEQYPNYRWNDIIESVDVQMDVEPSQVETILETKSTQLSSNDEDSFSSFKLYL